MLNRSENDIKKNWRIGDDTPLVSIRCITFNHERFIKDALEGFLKQETNFPFEIVIHDDASTDNTAEIIRNYEKKYPSIIKAIYEKENQFSKRDESIDRIMKAACKGKYIAYCEGDDYWTNPHKLQMQIDLMENDKMVSLVHTGFTTINENGTPIDRQYYQRFAKLSKKENGLISLFKKNHIMTLTIVIRKEVLDMDMFLKCPLKYDYALFFSAAFLGKIKYIPLETGAYRKVSTSLMNSKQSFVRPHLKCVYLYFVNEYLNKKLVLNITDRICIMYSILTNLVILKKFNLILQIFKKNPMWLAVMPLSGLKACFLRIFRQ